MDVTAGLLSMAETSDESMKRYMIVLTLILVYFCALASMRRSQA